MCPVEIRTLRYFLAVAREENMTRAAEMLHVTQPTLSKALKALEEELGKKLFTRHSFRIALTEEGALLRDRAEDLVTMADKIEKEFLSLDDITGGDLYFGLAESPDPLSRPSASSSEKAVSRAEIPHHQRRYGAGDRKAG
jgi:DNA-binding transcriptional LysR family regulator